MRLLSDHPAIRTSVSLIDANPWLVGFSNACQILDLQTGVTRPAQPEDLITKSLNISSIGDSAKATRWLKFLTQVFDGDVELIDWLHRWCGYVLTGSTREQLFLFFYGLGANGKSIFAETLRYVMGDYARAISPSTLTESRRQAGAASPDLANLIGVRMALSNETEDGVALAESLVKALTAGDTISVRPLYAGPVQFTPIFKLLMLGNHKPIIRGSDIGMWRRVRLVPFPKTFAAAQCDPHLIDKLKHEAIHIFAWMVEGCIEWQRRGLSDTPKAIVQATDKYREEQDVFANWLTECCLADPLAETTSNDLYSNFKAWCESNGQKVVRASVFGRRLKERGIESRRSNGRTIYTRLALFENGQSGDTENTRGLPI